MSITPGLRHLAGGQFLAPVLRIDSITNDLQTAHSIADCTYLYHWGVATRTSGQDARRVILRSNPDSIF